MPGGVAIWNRVQRADGADAKWRTLDSRSLHNQRLAVAPVADTDGNGAEVGGVTQDVMDLFSSRAVTGELDRTWRRIERQAGNTAAMCGSQIDLP